MAHTDRSGRPVVAVTGIGVVTSLGQGIEDNWRKLTAGESGIRRITRFPVDGLKTTIAGTVDFVPHEPPTVAALALRIAELAGEEAVAASGLKQDDVPGPLFLGFPPVEFEWPQRQEIGAASGANDHVGYAELFRGAATGKFGPMHAQALFAYAPEMLADRFGTRGAPIVTSTACATGATAIQLGAEAIRRGETPVALCIGADASVNPESLIRFSLLSALSQSNDPPEQAAKPFSANRDGFVMAEGAGALVLEELDHALARGAKILGIVEGCGERADDFHRTRSSPDGKPIIGCIRAALADAGLEPDAISYINAHGTGTPENDRMENLSVTTVFGEHAARIPISSNKSMIGHTLSASGAVEAIFSLLTMQRGRIPPTINHRVPDPAIPLDVVPNVARDADVARTMSNSFGFGGQNVSLVLAREPG